MTGAEGVFKVACRTELLRCHKYRRTHAVRNP